ncbi:hypothetical protein FFWV33_15785 [Flavobacterium faecale]|uniref:Uncharacterized protein n=1 Tax=Flavobacterium faecale TaxID=1355330 RepID=A0A2S1LGV4_9FLAO|nr:hypothetical protein [Flavobacterium faecale]AWG22881.1 hypothetical protein FFWV33_15785 [Flavobacterium faecale]
MKNLFSYLWATALLIIISSCSSDEAFSDKKNSSEANANLESIAKNDTVNISDIIFPLVGSRDTLKRPGVLNRLSASDSYEIDQLNEIPVFLKVMGNSSDKQFITASTKGAELNMSAYNGNLSQQYFIKVLPPSTGIRYLIYSKNTNTPVSVGSYQSNPNVKVLYSRNDSSGSLFGSSWDFDRGVYTSNSFVIKNQDYPESGGGSFWDIYYNAITVNDSKISFSKYNNNPRQEFEIIPVETFVVEKIEFDVDAGVILSNAPLQVYKEGYTNSGSIEQTYTFAINTSYTKSSNYNRSTSYKLTLSSTVKAGVPFFSEGEIKTSAEFGQSFTYGESESATIAVNRSYPVKVPSNNRADLTLTFFKYNMNVDYVATCRGLTSGKIIQIKGVWNGVDVEETNANLTLTPLNGGSVQKMEISQEMLNSKRIIEMK